MWLTWIALVPKTKHTQAAAEICAELDGDGHDAVTTKQREQTWYIIFNVTVRLFKVDLEERIFKYVLQGQP